MDLKIIQDSSFTRILCNLQPFINPLCVSHLKVRSPPPPSVSNFPLIRSFFFPLLKVVSIMTLNHTPLTHNRRRRREERVPPFEWENRPPPHRRLPSRMHYSNIPTVSHASELPSCLHYEKTEKWKDERWHGKAGRPWSGAGLTCKQDKMLHFYSFHPVWRIIHRQNYNYDGPGFPTEPRVSAERCCRHTESIFFLWSLLFLRARKSLNALMSSDVLLLSRDKRE